MMDRRLAIALAILALVVGVAVGRAVAPAAELVAASPPPVRSDATPALPTPRPTPTQTLPPAGPTADPYPTIPAWPVPTALGSERAAGSLVFTDRGGTFLYRGAAGTLSVLPAAPGAAVFALDPGVAWVRSSGVGADAPLFDARHDRYLRLLPREAARYGAAAVSADASTVAYVNDEGALRVAFQQPYGNVDGRALVVGRTFTRVALSPSGRTIVATAPTPGAASAGRVAPGDLWIVDVASGSVREVEAAHGSALAPLSWSPDDAYVVLWRSSGAAGVDATGVPLTMLDLATGTLVPLGNGFQGLSQRTWAGPNTFAFASVERPRVDNARIRVWSPAGGVRDVTPADAIAASPTAADGASLYFVAAAASGVAQVRVLDLATGSTRALWSDAAYAAQALRVSRDGTLLLVQRRRLADGELELWLDATDGSAHRAVIRYAPPPSGADIGRYGALYPELLDGVAWSRA